MYNKIVGCDITVNLPSFWHWVRFETYNWISVPVRLNSNSQFPRREKQIHTIYTDALLVVACPVRACYKINNCLILTRDIQKGVSNLVAGEKKGSKNGYVGKEETPSFLPQPYLRPLFSSTSIFGTNFFPQPVLRTHFLFWKPVLLHILFPKYWQKIFVLIILYY